MGARRESKPKSNRKILIIIIVVLLLLLLLALRSCKADPVQKTDLSAVKKNSKQTEAAIRKTGILEVKAVKDFPFFVYNPESGDEVAKGSCGITPIEIKPGKYLVRVKPDNAGLIPLGIAVIQENKTTTLEFKGFGTLYVDAAKDFIKYTVMDLDGNSIADGDTRISKIGLPVGTYMVKVNVSGIKIRKEAIIEDGKQRVIVFDDLGTLFVSGAKDFVRYNVFNRNGKKVAKGDTNITTLVLPAGDYTVETTILGKKAVDSVSIGKKQTARLNLKSFGALQVRAYKDFLKFAVKDKDGRQVTSGDTNITTLVLPVGSYTVECNGKIQKLEIEGADWKNLKFEEN